MFIKKTLHMNVHSSPFVIAPNQKQPKDLTTVKWINYGISMQWNTLGSKWQQTIDIYNNTGESQNQYVE